MANFTSTFTGKQVESRLANYCTCTTAASTAAKVVTSEKVNNVQPQFELFKGLSVRVKFTNSNTASSPTLNVNGTGAKSIVKFGTTAVGTTEATSWKAGAVVSFTYDGTYWVMENVQSGHTHSVGSGLKKTGSEATGDIKYEVNTDYTTSGKNYKVQVDSTSGGLFVNVPWQNDNTTYTAGEGIKITDNQIIAREHTHTVTHTPAGTVSQPTFTGDTVTSSAASGNTAVASSEHTHTVTPKGTVELDITEVTSGGNYQPKGTVSSSFTGNDHNHTFTGSAVTSTKPDTTNVSTIYSITGVGSTPSLTKTDTSPSKITEWSAGTLPNLTTKSKEVSIISGWSEGTVPTTTNITYVSGGSKSTVLTGVTHSGTTSVATGVTQGSGALVSYSEDSNTSSVKYDGETTQIPVIHEITTDTTKVSTGAKATSTGSVAPNEHTHSYTKATGVNLGSNTTATDGVQYVESISSTGASASGTAKVGSETHTHSHTPKGSVSIGVAADEVAGTYLVVTDAGPGDISTSTTNVAPNEHTHDITISGTTGTNSGTAVKAITGVGANGTVDAITSITATYSEAVLGLSAGSGSLIGDTTSTDGIKYIEDVSHTAATLSGTTSFNTDAIKSVSLSASSTSTDGPAYVQSVSGGSVGSGSLAAYDASSGGNVKVSNGTRIPVITSASHTAASLGTPTTITVHTSEHEHEYEKTTGVTLTADSSTATGRIKYVESVSHGASSLTGDTTFVKTQGTFSAGTTPPKSATPEHTSTATSSAGSGTTGQTTGGASTTTTSSAGANTSTTANTGSTTPTFTGSAVTSGGSSAASTGSATTLLSASVSGEVLTITSGTHTHTMSHTHSVTAAGTVGGHTHTYYKPINHTHTLSHTHTYTAPAAHTHNYDKTTSITLTAGTAPSLGAATTGTVGISSSAASVTTKYLSATPTTTTTATDPRDGNTATVVTGYPNFSGGSASHTTYYLAHGHTAPTFPTVTTKYMKAAGTAASKASVSISGGSISKTTKYLHHTHTPTAADSTGTVVTSISDSTTTVLTGVKATSTANVAPSGHTHSYGGSTALTTDLNSGTAVPAITEVTYTAPTYTRQALQATFTGTASNTGGPSATTTVVTGVTGGTASATKKYFHPTVTTTSANTGKNSGNGITAVTGVGNNGLVDVISTVTSDLGWLEHTHTSAKASGTATAITGVKSNGTASAYTSLDTASAKAVDKVGSLPILTYTDLTVNAVDSWSAGTLPTLDYDTETSTKINSWSAGSVPTRSSAIYVPNSEHTHNVTAAGTIGNTAATGTITSTFTGKQVLIEPTFEGTSVTTSGPGHTINVASGGHTHTVKATGTVSKPSFTGTAATITSSTSQLEEDN